MQRAVRIIPQHTTNPSYREAKRLQQALGAHIVQFLLRCILFVATHELANLVKRALQHRKGKPRGCGARDWVAAGRCRAGHQGEGCTCTQRSQHPEAFEDANTHKKNRSTYAVCTSSLPLRHFLMARLSPACVPVMTAKLRACTPGPPEARGLGAPLGPGAAALGSAAVRKPMPAPSAAPCNPLVNVANATSTAGCCRFAHSLTAACTAVKLPMGSVKLSAGAASCEVAMEVAVINDANAGGRWRQRRARRTRLVKDARCRHFVWRGRPMCYCCVLTYMYHTVDN